MSERNTVVRSIHDLGLAAWFGGTLCGAVGINGAAADVTDPRQRLRVATAGWGRWSPVNLVAIIAYFIGGAGQLYANKSRVAGQKGVGTQLGAKLAVTGLAVGATAWSGALGAKLAKYDGVPVEGGTEPSPSTPAEAASAQRQLKVLQWVLPVLTGTLVVLTALQGEQQRPSQQLPGILQKSARLVGVAS